MVAFCAVTKRTMFWLTVLLGLHAFAGPASSKKAVSKQVEANGLLLDLVESGANPNAVTNRLKYLGEEAYASRELSNAFYKQPGVEKRRAIAQVLAGLAHRDGENALFAGLADADAPVRMVSAQGLGRLKSSAAGPRLQGLLVDPTLGVRRDAARALGLIGEPKYGPALAKAAKAEEDPESRAVMLLATGQSGDKKQIPFLEGYLANGSESARVAAAAGLCVAGAPAGHKFAKGMLASKDRYQRMQGLQLFEGAKAKDAAATIEPLLKDEDRSLQAVTARILYQGGDKSKLDWLVLHSFQALGEDRLPYEKELETLRLTDDDRRAILRKAGIK
jgi:HEAT repeat protein